MLERARLEGPIVEILEEHEAYPSALPARRDVAHSAWVTIQIGCDNSCTFCIVPIVRGREVSRRLGDVVREIEELADQHRPSASSPAGGDRSREGVAPQAAQ